MCVAENQANLYKESLNIAFFDENSILDELYKQQKLSKSYYDNFMEIHININNQNRNIFTIYICDKKCYLRP